MNTPSRKPLFLHLFLLSALISLGVGCDESSPSSGVVFDDAKVDMPTADQTSDLTTTDAETDKKTPEPDTSNPFDILQSECGNDRPEGSELCDDGEENGLYGKCGLDCTSLGPRCGDGELQADQGELCDDGEKNGEMGSCRSDCRGVGELCGNGELDGDEVCDDGMDNGVYDRCAEDCTGPGPRCGDGIVNGSEFCDDGDENGEYQKCGTQCARPPFVWSHEPQLETTWLNQPPVCEQGDWWKKSFEYRLRLRGNGTAQYPGFTSVGLEAGQSLVASSRNPHTSCVTDWGLNNAGCTPEIRQDLNGLLSFGDSTIWLGYYIGMLGAEYASFTKLGLDTTETEQDLYYALMAFNRLDEQAEKDFGAPPVKDGFFRRDDVPQEFVFNTDGSARFPHDKDGKVGYGCVKGGGCSEPRLDDGAYISQDQAVGMVFGTALVTKFVPAGVVVEGLDLHEESKAIIHRMVTHLRDNSWMVTGPNGDHPPAQWGGNAVGMSDQLAKAANLVVGNAYGVEDYRNTESKTVGAAAFEGLVASWTQQIWYNRSMALEIASITGEWNPTAMARRSADTHGHLFSLAYSVFHERELGDQVSEWKIEALLDSAPCSGPCHHVEGCEGNPMWRGNNRFRDAHRRNGDKHSQAGEYPGVDYLLLHYLYFLYRDGQSSTYPTAEIPADCSHFVGLDDVIAGNVPNGAVYDPFDACAVADMQRSFCGRPWASWLDSSYRRKTQIWANGVRFECGGEAPCAIVEDDDEGNGDDQLILGSSGNDDLYGAGGNDCIYGFEGADNLRGGQGHDEIHGGPGNDEIYGENKNLVVDGEADILYGEDGDDMIKGGPGRDELHGGPGNDTMHGDGGDDMFEGGPGDDWAEGEGGEDQMYMGPGNDTAYGDGDDDYLVGGPGRDALDGGRGDDWIYSHEDDDILRGGKGDDRLVGDIGDDRLCDEDGTNIFYPEDGNNGCRPHDANNPVWECDYGLSEADCSDAAFENW